MNRDEGRKHDDGKLPISLLSSTALKQVAEILQYGARKYDAHNWRKGLAWSRVIDAALRHLLAFNEGEDLDKESKLSHVAHAACNLMFLLEYIETHPELDDRYKQKKEKKNDYKRLATVVVGTVPDTSTVPNPTTEHSTIDPTEFLTTKHAAR